MIIQYSKTLKIRITDINFGGHLGHMELLGLLHEVRAQFLKKFHLTETDISNAVLVMRQLMLNYLNQAYWDNTLKIEMVIEVVKAKIFFKYTVHNITLKNITAKAEAAMVLIDKSNHKVLKPQVLMRQILSN